MFGPKIIEQYHSKFSGKLFVKSTWGHRYVTSGFLTQSGGLIKDLWEPVLKKINSKNKTWLVLGLATGTVALLINKYQPQKITGIEIDPAMIDIGKKYFALDKIPNLEIINQDADRYLQTAKQHFDFILVDVYLGDKLPGFVYSAKFLEKIKKIGSTVVINHLFYDLPKKQQAEKLVHKLEKIFASITLQHVLTNLMIICQ